MKRYYYSFDVALYCDITMRAVRLAVQKGRLKGFIDPRYKRKVFRYRHEDVEAFQAGRKPRAGSF